MIKKQCIVDYFTYGPGISNKAWNTPESSDSGVTSWKSLIGLNIHCKTELEVLFYFESETKKLSNNFYFCGYGSLCEWSNITVCISVWISMFKGEVWTYGLISLLLGVFYMPGDIFKWKSFSPCTFLSLCVCCASTCQRSLQTSH